MSLKKDLHTSEFYYKLPELTEFKTTIMSKRPTPKKQQANSQSSRRYKAFQNRARKRLVNSVGLTTCPKCKEAKMQHSACSNCGEYNGRQVLDMGKKMDKITKVKA